MKGSVEKEKVCVLNFSSSLYDDSQSELDSALSSTPAAKPKVKDRIVEKYVINVAKASAFASANPKKV